MTAKKKKKVLGKKKAAAKKKATQTKTAVTRRCAMMEHHAYLASTDDTYRRNRRTIERFSVNARLAASPARSSILRIPVVVHVLHHTDRENISRGQIDSQIEALNRDYRARNPDRVDIPAPFKDFAADSLIEFALAVRDPRDTATTGITRTRTSIAEFPYDPFDSQATANLDALIKHDEFGRAAWPSDHYLNFWVCNIEGGLLGYAAFPGAGASTDGVVVNNTAFGSGGTAMAPFDLGRTAVHEVGHWLNLLHIWGDDQHGCSGSDNVSDTPNQAGSNGSGITKNSFPLISCNNGPNGDMFMNYMDYVNDAVMVMFTKGQLARMNDTLNAPRASLGASKGLVPVVTEPIDIRDIRDESPNLAEAIGCDAEYGHQAELVFDGVSWISAT